MLKFPKTLAASLIISLWSAPLIAGEYNLGREATKDEVAAWNIDVRPDGQGLPEGKGTVAQGEEIWSEKCASCHGDFGEGVDRWPVLAGGGDTLSSDDPVKTIGSYWPYLTTVFDYVNRAMPFTEARSLEADEVYALTAYLLFVNDLVSDETFELSKANFLEKRLPNEHNFFDDDRLSSPIFNRAEPCMKACKSEVNITGRARILDVTPENSSDN
jgi:mono/diheme cytochrome c family protein